MKIYTKMVWQWLPDGTPAVVESESFDYEGPVSLAKDSPSPPPAPDYAGAATAQGAANRETAVATAKLGNPNVISPYGSQTVSYGGTGAEEGLIPTVTQTLSPDSQAIFDQQQQVRRALAGLSQQGITTAQGTMGTPFNFTGPDIQTSIGNPNVQTTVDNPAVRRSIFGAAMNPVSPNASSGGTQGQLTNAGGGANPSLQDAIAALRRGDQAGGQGMLRSIVGLPDLPASTGRVLTPGVGQNTRPLGPPPNQAGQPYNPSIAAMPVNAGTTGQQAIMARLQPQLERARQQQETQLRNQGLVQGGEAYGNAMTAQHQRENDLLSQAGLYGINLDLAANQQGFGQALAGAQFENQATGQQFGQNLQTGQFANQGAGQQFGQGLQAGQFGNTAGQQDYTRQLYERNLPLNEITALMSGSQIQNPQFQQYTGSNINPAPIFNAAQQQAGWNQGLYNQQVGTQNANTAGLYGLGAAGIGAFFSDRRLKSNIVRIGTHPLNIGVYEYDIFGNRERGVMADEVLTVRPEAVITHPSGYMMVDYGRL